MPTLTATPQLSRPREKLYAKGVEALNLEEILAIILRTGCQGFDVRSVSHTVAQELQQHGPNLERPTHVRGLGRIKACEIVAACALHTSLRAASSPVLNDPASISQQMCDLLDDPREHLVAFFMTVRSHQIHREVISIGTLTASLVHPREVFRPAILANASRLILAHTHPSGCAKPSSADLTVTKRLVEAGRGLGIDVIDHIVCAQNEFVSLRFTNPGLFLESGQLFC